MKIGSTKLEILLICAGLCERYYRTYCYPPRAKIIELLELLFKNTISLSALDQHISELNKVGLWKSYQQKGQRPNGTWYNKPSNRQLTKKGTFFLKSHGYKFKTWFLAWVKTGALPKAMRKAYNLAKLNKEKESESGKSYEDLHSWLKTPSLILKAPT